MPISEPKSMDADELRAPAAALHAEIPDIDDIAGELRISRPLGDQRQRILSRLGVDEVALERRSAWGVLRNPDRKTYQRLSVVIPCYNEEKTLPAILARVLTAPIDLDMEVVLSDDGSSDGTPDLIRHYVARFENDRAFRLVGVFGERNRGKGAALRAAFEKCTGDIILIQDADLEYDPEDYPHLIRPIRDGVARVVYGSRWHNRHFHRARPGSRPFFFGNYLMALAANLLYRARVSDEATCYKVFDADLLRSISLDCEGFEFCPEVTAKVRRLGEPIWEVPIYYYPRSVAEGKKIRYTDGLTGLWTLVRYMFWKPARRLSADRSNTTVD